ncbi:MAG: hypothetical protein ACRYHA_13050 [Janthinobacterium lividum]
MVMIDACPIHDRLIGVAGPVRSPGTSSKVAATTLTVNIHALATCQVEEANALASGDPIPLVQPE